MTIKKIILCGLMLSLVLRAQEGELTLDPNDIPLTPDPSLNVPADESLTLPNLDEMPPDPTLTPAQPNPHSAVETPVAPTPIAPHVELPSAEATAPRQVEEFKPTPSNLEVKSEVQAFGREERFNQTYTRYHKDKTSPENWQKVVGKRTSDTYIVNKGDTLWDISGTLFGDPFYWPKVWSLNKEMIYNPHVIFPDMKIKFFQGDSKALPTLAADNKPGVAVEEKKEIAKNEDLGTVDSDDDGNQADPVPKNETIKTALRKLPSFFRDKDVRIQKEIDIQIEERKSVAQEAMLNFEFYISEEALTSVGEVVEVESEFKSAGEDQYVFVKMSVPPEGIYTIVKSGKKLSLPAVDGEKVEYNVKMHEVEGEVRILGRVNSHENVYRARVTKSNSLVSEGSLVLAGRMRTFRLSDATVETTASKGRIIGNLNAYGIIGQGNFVLINQGSLGGYQANIKLPIYEDLGRRRVTSLVRENPMKVGSLLIIDATANFSIGYVTRVTDRVVVNDLVAIPDGADSKGDDSAKAEPNFEDTAAPPNEEPAPIEEF
ncbi:MAG: LysM peptidoglycan-binding domain-containing protein [Bdellovibrionaceae bacterium]|nr:LysM peptidoglycan-binding domain-containing protein [Pseudobdellovibrionaceae bacterium]